MWKIVEDIARKDLTVWPIFGIFRSQRQLYGVSVFSAASGGY
jgi:hypothetical protein